MAGRHYGSEVDYYDDRREYVSRNGRSRHDDRYVEEDYRRGPPVREREREVLIREETRSGRQSPRSGPAFLRDDYGRTAAGPVVLRARETEDFEFAARPRRRSPSPEPERKLEREEIIIRRDESESRPPPRPRDDREREEIIIRQQSSDREARIPSRRYEDRLPPRPISHERERSRRAGSDSEQEIVIRREERDGRGVERQEIIVRNTSRSPSPAPSSVRAPPPEPPIIQAPPIHQEVITHHRHIDHGYELALAPRRPASRPPSPPMPPAPRSRSEERIEIHRSGERNGRAYDEDIIINRDEGGRSAGPRSPPARNPYHDYPPPGVGRGYDRDVQEEAEYYNNRALDRGYVGEGYHGATRDWALVDVPPGTRRVRMDGAGGGAQEITWQRYNGVRRSKFLPDGSDEGYGSEVGRPAPVPGAGGEIGRRFGTPRDPRDGLWTEVTKDLVVKEAIKEMGYEYEETDDFYYIIAYLRYEDVARLVGLSEDIRKDRRKRMKEMEWENRLLPLPAPPVEDFPPRPMIEAPPMHRPRDPHWDVEDERYIEREIVYRGGRPPPPVGWRR